MNDIPKVIHYCWFGGKPLPKLALKCIRSWRKYLPDYEIKEWNESNFDVHMTPYSSEAYKAGKYAFVSDFARFWILNKYGGLYFDTDVEVIRDMSRIISSGPFMGCEKTAAQSEALGGMLWVAPGLGLGATAGMPFYEEMLEFYSTLHFLKEDGSLNLTTVVDYTSEKLKKYGLELKDQIQEVAGMKIYPVDYFCPIHDDARTLDITPRTVSIHHYAASWVSGWPKWRERIKQLVGPRVTEWVIRMRHGKK